MDAQALLLGGVAGAGAAALLVWLLGWVPERARWQRRVADLERELEAVRRRLAEVTTSTAEVFDAAARRIDESARKAVRTNRSRTVAADEIGEELDPLAAAAGSDGDASDRAARRMETAVAQISQLGRELSAEAGGLERSSGFIADLVAAMESASRDRGDAQGLADAANEAIAAAAAMDEALRRVQDSAGDTANLSKEVESHAEDGYRAVHRTLDEIERIRDLTEIARERIDALGERVAGIGDVVRVIQEITEKTNLLALNASIIAAQAGQHGRSFAVVAREIKALAQRTAASTKEITEQIRGVQEETERATQAMANGTAAVKHGFEIAVGAGDALGSIRESARHARKRVTHMNRSFRQQTAATQQVVDLVGKVSDRAAALASSARGDQAADRLATAAAELHASGGRLAELVAKHKDATANSTDAFAELLAEVVRLSRLERDLRKSLDGMRRGVTGTRDASTALDKELQLVREATQQLRDEIGRLQAG